MTNMYRIAAVKHNDIVDGEGICVSVWTQGCPHRCPGCHNPGTWDFTGGYEISRDDLLAEIDSALDSHGVHRNFSILGGEPLAAQNVHMTNDLILHCVERHPESKIFLWTGYTIEELKSKGYPYSFCLDYVDVIIDGRYVESLRDLTLELRGSSNQRVLKKGIDY